MAPSLIFSPWTLKALDCGWKDVTRRLLVEQPPEGWGFWGYDSPRKGPTTAMFGHTASGLHSAHWRCPYGEAGSVVWAREQHAWEPLGEDRVRVIYRADETSRVLERRPEWRLKRPGVWRSPLHLFEEWARWRLRLTEVSVERIQSLSVPEAIAEGVAAAYPDFYYPDGQRLRDRSDTERPLRAFRAQWEALHGESAWERNPWVWRLRFVPWRVT